MARYAHIIGWGMAVPERVLTNQELEGMVDTSDEWITTRTGIRTRHIAGERESTASLATEAARRALRMTALSAIELDLIIVATASPEHLFPATACLVQDAIGAARAGAFDLSAACTGFIYALNMAAQAIRSGSIQHALVIGAETLSRLVDWKDRNTCVLFGDGAGAVVLSASDVPGGVLSCVMRSDGSGANLLYVAAGGSRYPASPETVEKGMHTIRMNGREVFRFATRVMASSTREAVSLAGLQLEDIEVIIPHQANRRIIESAARGLKLPLDRFLINIDRYGNTSSASIPIALCEGLADGRINPGDHVVMVAFGGGLTWGALTMEWVGVEMPVTPRARWRRRFLRRLARLRSFLVRILRKLEGLLWGARSHPRSSAKDRRRRHE
jgi:3-oxoacyl-[acyl-carrier-protein] synthase-3